MKKIVKKKLDGKKMTVDELAGIVKNSFTNLEESFETKLEEKLEEKLETKLDEKIGSFRTEMNSKFFEVKDQLGLLQNQMGRVEKLFDKNDAEHKVFRTKIGHLEKTKQ